MRKPFDQALHDENDQVAKQAVRDLIKFKWNLDCQEGDKYAVDLVVMKDGEILGYAEVERRHNWVGEFSFPTVHVPYRKQKFFSLNKPTLLFAVSKDLSLAMYCGGEEILSSPVEFINNRYAENEPFFDVPIKLWKTVELLPF